VLFNLQFGRWRVGQRRARPAERLLPVPEKR